VGYFKKNRETPRKFQILKIFSHGFRCFEFEEGDKKVSENGKIFFGTKLANLKSFGLMSGN
jgi:hypothetical protein